MAKNNRKPDYPLLIIISILIILGIIILASVSAPFSFKTYGNTYYLLLHQIGLGLLPGLILGILIYKRDLSFLKKYSPALLLGSLILMFAVFLPVIGGGLKGGASRWLSLGPLSFQPSELLKIAAILYLATWLAARTEKQKTFKQTSWAFVAFIILVVIVLMLQSNASTLCVIVAVAIIMYFSANAPLSHVFTMALFGALGLFAAIKFFPYRMNRFLVFLDKDFDPMNLGYQLKQSMIAIGSGGATGVGLGMSSQKFGLLPQTIADSIFAVFSEESGFVGSAVLIILFLAFLIRGFQVAKRSDDTFSRLAAIGITSWIVIQAFVNIGAMIGLLPLTGIPLPFISYGGSALIFEVVGMAILLNISRKT